jgi:hypothetical protein
MIDRLRNKSVSPFEMNAPDKVYKFLATKIVGMGCGTHRTPTSRPPRQKSYGRMSLR